MLLGAFLDLLDVKGYLLLLFVFLLVFDLLKNRNPPNFPAGPWPLPFLGNVFVGFDHHAMDKVAKQYGDIFSLRRGGEKMVVVSGYKSVKEVLITQGDYFLDRPVSPLFTEAFQGYGISLSNGYRWRRQRHFAVSHLRNFGEGKRSLEFHVQQECSFLCEAFQEECGGAFNPHVLINNAAANIIGSLVFGKRFDYDATDFQNLLSLSAETMLLVGSPVVQLYDMFPWLVKRFRGPHETILANYGKLAAFIKREVNKHKRDWDPFDHRDFIDAYIGEIDKRKKDTEAAFNVDNLAFCTLDLFEAGTETITTTLRWALLLMMKYPDVQGQVQAEIDRVIGDSRQPCLADRVNMPLTEAVIHETQRFANLLPLTIPRLTSKDTTLCGYFIPKGTMVITNLSSVLRDKSEWETPDQFNPKHFLNEQGLFRKREAFFPFAAGKRMCLGEQLAQMELFLFFTSLLQRFSFSPADGVEPTLEPQGTGVLSPKPFLIHLSLR
ncbi:cytochrome P450 2J2 [Chanos chanos]|uniref:Cytochrome P450 2J2 n=1 Tax=Chanos chanos TaxID=29144 RepID=A0A6J2WWH7_CHACN|nr:cytochrome P450 2J2-like [Chanos chanos]